jgi:hypothetical protein
MLSLKKEPTLTLGKRQAEDFDKNYMGEAGNGFSSDEDDILPKPKKRATSKALRQNVGDMSTLDECEDPSVSPRTVHLLSIINSRDVSQIKLLKGVGAKKAEAIVDCLCEMDQAAGTTDEIVSDQPQFQVGSLAELSTLKGVGVRTVENMRSGVLV